MIVLAEGAIFWILKDGLVKFWFDNWDHTGPLYNTASVIADHRVIDFVRDGVWDQNLLNQSLHSVVVSQVSQISPPSFHANDDMVWSLSSTDKFSMSSPSPSEKSKEILLGVCGYLALEYSFKGFFFHPSVLI